MPNFVDQDRMGATNKDAKVVNMEEYKAQAEIKRSTAQSAFAPSIEYINVTTLVMIALIVLALFFGFRRS